jgi:hypothetical protein
LDPDRLARRPDHVLRAESIDRHGEVEPLAVAERVSCGCSSRRSSPKWVSSAEHSETHGTHGRAGFPVKDSPRGDNAHQDPKEKAQPA